MLLRYNIFNKIKIFSVTSLFHLRVLTTSSYQMNCVKRNKLYLRHESNSDHFQATFNWRWSSHNVDREFNFNRRISEKLEDFLGRVKTNVEKVILKKVTKKKKSSPEETENFVGDLCVKVCCDTLEIPGDVICEDLFFGNLYDANKLIFIVMDNVYDVVINAPWIVRLSLPSSIMAGFPIYPTIDIKFGNKYDSKFIWYRHDDVSKDWMEVGNSLVYIPSTEEIGKKLKLVCIPGNGKSFGSELTVEANVNVEAGPGLCHFHTRQELTKETLPLERFRVVSYNILADLYAETDVAKTELFPYCPPYAIGLDYRKQLYLQEIVGYNADIVCLQEVDVKVFDNDLQDILGLKNLRGVLTRKGANVAEGVATFYSTEKFRLIETKSSELGEEVDVNPIYKNIWSSIQKNKNLRERFKERTTVLQVLILESLWDSRKKIIVGNTHLFFHPDADHIRLLQGGMILAFIEDCLKYLNLKYPMDNVSFIMCGDFNSTPDSGIYRLMTTNYIPTDIIDWKSKKGEEVVGLELKHPFSVESACGTPQFTNYTAGFSGCLDYIYYEKNKLNVIQTVPLPDEEILKSNVAIPSVTFPSDHIALIADFEWKS